MKKIMVLMMTVLLAGGMSVSAFARGELIRGHTGSFHSHSHGVYTGYQRNHYAGFNHHSNCCYGNYYGNDDDDSIGPFIAGGVFGAILGNVLNR